MVSPGWADVREGHVSNWEHFHGLIDLSTKVEFVGNVLIEKSRRRRCVELGRSRGMFRLKAWPESWVKMAVGCCMGRESIDRDLGRSIDSSLGRMQSSWSRF